MAEFKRAIMADKNTFFGMQTEHNARIVWIDIQDFVDEFGNPDSYYFVNNRPTEEENQSYVVPLSQCSLSTNPENNRLCATWELSNADTAISGIGKFQFTFVPVGRKALSAIYSYTIKDSIVVDPEYIPPSPYENLLEDMANFASSASQSARESEAAEQRAETASQHYPIVRDEYWYVWDVDTEDYVNTGVKASGGQAEGAVLYNTLMSLTDSQKEVARGNIEAASDDDVTDVKSALQQCVKVDDDGYFYVEEES